MNLDPAIPHMPRLPLVGNALTLDSHAPVQHLVRLARRYGPLFAIDIMGAPLLIASGASLMDDLSDETRFDKAVRGPLARVRAVAGHGLFTSRTNDPRWARAHNILLSPFGGKAMQTYHPKMVDLAEQLCLKWARLNPDEDIDVVHDMTALTLDTIGLCGFDYRFNSFYRRDDHPFVEAMVRSLESVMMMRGVPLERFWLRSRMTALETDVAFMNAIVDDIVRDRRVRGVSDENDLLNAMLTGVDRTSGERLDDVNIRDQINTFLIAGHETTSGLLSFALYALLKNPRHLATAVAEVDRVLGPDRSIAPTFAQIAQLSYIAQVMKETLRLWPTAPGFLLYPFKDERLDGRFPIPGNITISVLSPALHRDPAIWGDTPETFNPDNFTPAAERARPKNVYKPFGNGQRACIGRGFALHEAGLALSMILHRFELEDHADYTLKIKETLTIKPEGFRMRARLRPSAPHGARSHFVPPVVAAVRPHVAAHGSPFTVAYGSNLGACEDLARRFADLAERSGYTVDLQTLDAFVRQPAQDGPLAIFCGSYNGAPPDNAAQGLAYLEHDAPPDAFAGRPYLVFGCGNRDWTATYQSVPRRIDAALVRLGGRAVAPRGEGDAREDLDAHFSEFLATLPAACAAHGLPALETATVAGPLYHMEPVAPPSLPADVAQACAIRENRELINAGPRSTRHIVLALPKGVTYAVGDHLAVAPRNPPERVAAVAAHFGFGPGATIKLIARDGRRAPLPTDTPITVERLLTDYVELAQPATQRHLHAMAAASACPATAARLAALAAPEMFRTEIQDKRRAVFDLLVDHPACALPFETFLEMAPTLQPRYYSIASAPDGTGACSLTVAVVEGPARSGRGVFRGLCSTYLQSLAPGARVFADVRANPAFHPPQDARQPLIMIGPGTGLAPFRGFLQARRAAVAAGQTLGPALLFFGCRRPDEDYLYRDELEADSAAGLMELHVAFSREGPEKVYVQDFLRAQSARIAALLDAGATVFVCGDGGAMEPAVRQALIDIQSAASGAPAQDWMDAMIAQGRYRLDVWRSV